MNKGKEQERNQEATVYVGNIDEEADEEIIYELMLQAGPVVSVYLPKDRVNQSHQGYGFVEFKSVKDAEYAKLIMNQIRVYGKPLRIDRASADKVADLDVGAEVFVGNLDPQVDEGMLFDTFSTFGGLLGQPKVTRDETGESRGFGFLSFNNFESSDKAIESMNNQYLLSKPIVLSYAFKKEGKGERHGDEVERLLAAQAQKHNYQLPVSSNNAISTESSRQPSVGFNTPIPTGPANRRPRGTY
jgi:splicing factor 3B subunit 4